MADKSQQAALLSSLSEEKFQSIQEIMDNYPGEVAERTLRRWLAKAVEQGHIIKVGQKRSTRYCRRRAHPRLPGFLKEVSPEKRSLVLKKLRDLWTHTSTALEGNTLTLGDTHFILEEGLTVSGKPLKEHQEVLGHATAIDLIYGALKNPITEQFCFDLHRAVQTEIVYDMYKPNGAWKVTPNFTYTVDANDQQVVLEYAKPQHVPALMRIVLDTLNAPEMEQLVIDHAHLVYAKIHAAIAHIHPFWDGNGRIARLLANIPLLKSGLPPIIIPKEQRRHYFQTLAAYEIAAGNLSPDTGPWPDIEKLTDFEAFCSDCYRETRHLLLGEVG